MGSGEEEGCASSSVEYSEMDTRRTPPRKFFPSSRVLMAHLCRDDTTS